MARQEKFFAATADRDGRLYVSPKGMDTLKILGPERTSWPNLTGSGNETAAHAAAAGRMTLMFFAFDGDPLTLRTYRTRTNAQSIDGNPPVS